MIRFRRARANRRRRGVAGAFALLALAGAGASSSRRRSRQPQAIDAATLVPRTGSAGARSPRNASYTITARLDPASRTLTGEQLLTWRNTSTIPATSLRFHLYYNAWRNTRSTWMRERALAGDSDAGRPSRGGLGLDRRHQPEARRHERRAGRRHLDHALHRARRWEPGRPHGGRGPARGAGRARRNRQRPDRLVLARAAHVRAHRRDRQLLLPRPVVSEDRRLPGHRLELPSVPRRDRVLLRLRHLRRPPDGPERLDRRRDRHRARAARRGRPDDDASLLCGGRPRFRLDDEPRLRRAARTVRPRGPAAGVDAPAAPARARRARRSAISTRRARRCATTASGSARIPTRTSP